MAATGLLLLLLPLARAEGTAPAESCCEVQQVSDQGELDGWYTLNTSPAASLELICLNSCIYNKLGEDGTGKEYCFKSAAVDFGAVQCTALPTDAPVTGSTLPPTEENLKVEKQALQEDLANDEKELEEIQEEENDAIAVDSGLAETEATIDRLTGGGEATTTSGRVKRQAAENCQEIASLVDEMEKETNTKNKLKIIQRITTTTITVCSEGDIQILKQKKTVIKSVKLIVKGQIVKIREKKVKVSIKIYKKKKKIKKVIDKLNALIATTKPPRPTVESGSGGDSGAGEGSGSGEGSETGKGPEDGSGDGSGSEEQIAIKPGSGEEPTTGSGEEPITVFPTGDGEEPIAITFRPTGTPNGEEPIKITFRPTGRPSGEEPIEITYRPTGRPSGEEPIEITYRPTGRPSGEEPIEIGWNPTGKPSGEEPITIGTWPTWKPTGEEPIVIGGRPSGEEPITIVMKPTGEAPMNMNPTGEKPMNMMASGLSLKPTGGAPAM